MKARYRFASSCAGGATLLAAWLTCYTAAAAPAPEEVAVAQQHFTEAREQQQHKDWVGCENSIKQAIQISETPGLRFHLAFCKEQQHRWVEALVDYRRAGELVAQGAKAEDVAELLPGATQNLERQTPQLTLLLEEMPEGARLYVDDKPISSELLGVTFPVDPGTRRVRVTAPGYTQYLQEVNLVPQDRRTLRVLLVKVNEGESLSAERVDARPRKRGEPSALSGLGLTLASEAVVALGGLGVGVGFTASASFHSGKTDDYKRQIDDLALCEQPYDEGSLCDGFHRSRDDAARARLISTVGYVTASAATVAFVVTWLVWPDDEEPTVQVTTTDEGRGALVLVHADF